MKVFLYFFLAAALCSHCVGLIILSLNKLLTSVRSGLYTVECARSIILDEYDEPEPEYFEEQVIAKIFSLFQTSS